MQYHLSSLLSLLLNHFYLRSLKLFRGFEFQLSPKKRHTKWGAKLEFVTCKIVYLQLLFLIKEEKKTIIFSFVIFELVLYPPI